MIKHKSLTVVLIVTFVAVVTGVVAYRGLLKPPPAPDKQFTKINPEPTPEIKQALDKKKQEKFQQGDVITDGETTIVNKALPPGGELFLKELNEISEGIKQDLAKEEQNIQDLGNEAEIEKIIAESNALIRQVDAEHNLGTQAFLSKMLETDPPTNDPELIELDSNIDNLEAEVETIFRSLE